MLSELDCQPCMAVVFYLYASDKILLCQKNVRVLRYVGILTVECCWFCSELNIIS
jgi:hypothetical protein